MIDVTELLHDPDFATQFTVIRSQGEWKNGRFLLGASEKLGFFFPAHPATEDELELVPEGDREKETMTFFCAKPKRFVLSREDENNECPSDRIHYKGHEYKLVAIKDWSSHGWQRGIAVLIGAIKTEKEDLHD